MKLDQNTWTMDLPVEILIIVFPFLHPNVMGEIFATYKLFYHLPRRLSCLLRNLTFPRNCLTIGASYINFILICWFVFENQLFVCLKDFNINEENLHLAENVILDKIFHSIVSFSCVDSLIYL